MMGCLRIYQYMAVSQRGMVLQTPKSEISEQFTADSPVHESYKTLPSSLLYLLDGM